MKITDVKIINVTGKSKAYPPMYRARSARAVDVYPEFDADDHPNEAMARPSKLTNMDFLKIETDSGIDGFYNISPYLSVGFIIIDMIRPHLLGADPLDMERILNILALYERHARVGLYMIAVSLVEICLWDIKGKKEGEPLYKLLGGARDKIDAYGSMLGYSVDPERAAEIAVQKKNEGLKAQKWFFRWGLAHGKEGMDKNIDLVRHIREAVGDDYQLMFDAWMAWDVPYTRKIADKMEQYNVKWLEEPLRPRDFDGYKTLRDTIDIPMSAGEHIYTHWEAKHWLEAGILGYMQADPDWTGGVSETIKIGKLCQKHGAKLVPHGHSVYGASAVVASMPEGICPMAEVLLLGMEQRQVFYKESRLPKNGVIHMPDTPGVGVAIDESKIESMEERFTEFKK